MPYIIPFREKVAMVGYTAHGDELIAIANHISS